MRLTRTETTATMSIKTTATMPTTARMTVRSEDVPFDVGLAVVAVVFELCLGSTVAPTNA